MAARLFNLMLCALLLELSGPAAKAITRSENRVGGSPVFSSDFASQGNAKPIAASGQNAACGYDFTSGTHKYLYAQDDPVDYSDPSGHDVLGTVSLAMGLSGMLDALPSISFAPVRMAASSLSLKILPVHAYSLARPDTVDKFGFSQAIEAVNAANAILAQASIKMELNPSDFHLWDANKTMNRAGYSMRPYLSKQGDNGGPGKNWGTITEGQDTKVANVYFSSAFQNEQGEVNPTVLGMSAMKGNPDYPAVFLADPWGSVFAHEIGHVLGLTHNDQKNELIIDENNLMYWAQSKPNPNAVLTKWQINQMRTSPLLR